MRSIIDPGVLRNSVSKALSSFDGRVCYAVKANPHPLVVRMIRSFGLKDFDVASKKEINLVKRIAPDADLLYTHPVKKLSEILHAYREIGLRYFVVDGFEEIERIFKVCNPKHLEISVRFKTGTPKNTDAHELDSKFGTDTATGIRMLEHLQASGCKTSVSFHVGSQQTLPDAHFEAAKYLANSLSNSSFSINSLSLGGGFPVSYETTSLTDLSEVFPNVDRIRSNFTIFQGSQMIVEPGRCLIADAVRSEVTVTCVEGRRLFIDDGIYGGLLDCALSKVRYPISHRDRPFGSKSKKFKIFGPTCDSLDVLPGEYSLPCDTKENDVLVIHKTGAYGGNLTNNFNGLVPRQKYLVGPAFKMEDA